MYNLFTNCQVILCGPPSYYYVILCFYYISIVHNLLSCVSEYTFDSSLILSRCLVEGVSSSWEIPVLSHQVLSSFSAAYKMGFVLC